MKKHRKIIFVLLALVAMAVLTEPFTHFFHRIADTLIYDNYHHYLPCSSLPELTEVENVVSQHKDVVADITNLNPENIEFIIDYTTCPGKASIIIYYASNEERTKIQDFLPENTFFGVPISMINR